MTILGIPLSFHRLFTCFIELLPWEHLPLLEEHQLLCITVFLSEFITTLLLASTYLYWNYILYA